MLKELGMDSANRGKNSISEAVIAQLLSDCDLQLRSIMALWSENCVDTQHGGYLTCFDRSFSLYDTRKGAWGQARHIYTYAAMAEYDPPNRQRWLDLAKVGIDFTFNKMFAGNNRLNYLVSQSGDEVLEGPTSIFSDAFAISGLAEYIRVSNSSEYTELLKAMYGQFVEHVLDPAFKDIAPAVFDPEICHHSIHMIAINTAHLVGRVLGKEQTYDFIRTCLDVIFSVLVDADTHCLLEKKRLDGSFSTGNGSHFVNVGHTFECMWFCLEVAIAHNDFDLVQKIVEVSEATYVRGTDQGVLQFSFDLGKAESVHQTWKYEIEFHQKDRVSWAFAESMVLFLKLYAVTHDNTWFDRFLVLKEYVDTYFLDTKYGDWFHALHEEGSVKIDIKGSTVKSAYHIPRAYMKMIEALHGMYNS